MKTKSLAFFLAACFSVFSKAAVESSTHAYGTHPLQVLDLYSAKTAKPAPLLVFIHGGAWISGSRAHYSHLGQFFPSKGISVALVDYRLSSTATDNSLRHPEHVKDGAKAVRWLFANAAKLGVDPKRVFLSGHSAGAHLIALLGVNGTYLPEFNQVAGYIGMAGIYDIPVLVKRFPTYRDWFLIPAFGERSTEWGKASPNLTKIESKRPWLLIQSDDDRLIDRPQTELFAKTLTAAGASAKALYVQGFDHDSVVATIGRASDPITSAILALF